MARFLTATALITAVQALAIEEKPSPAVHDVVPFSTFHLPHITPGPDIRDVLKRQSSQSATVLIAPDNTCGYVSGRAGAPYTCNGANTCAFVIEEGFGAVGCCHGDVCGLRATCLDYKQVFSQSACDNGCLQDTFTAKCTDTSFPYCGTVTFFSGIRDYYCDSLSISTPQQLYTTYAGETGRTFQEFFPSSTATASETGSFVFSPSESSSSTAILGGGGNNNGNGGNGNNGGGNDNGGGGNNGGGSGSNSPSMQSSTPIGAIVGGVVGGVAVLALIGLAIFFIVRRNKKGNNPEPPMEQAPAAAAAGAGAAASPPPSYPQQLPGQPQGYYPNEQKPAGFVPMGPAGVPDRLDSTSPVSHVSDPRLSAQPITPASTINGSWSPAPTVPTIPATVHEAGGNAVGDRDYNSNHHGQFHEMSA